MWNAVPIGPLWPMRVHWGWNMTHLSRIFGSFGSTEHHHLHFANHSQTLQERSMLGNKWGSTLTSTTSQDLWSTSFVSGTVLSALHGFSCLILTARSYILQVRKLSFEYLKEHGQEHTGQVRTQIWAQDPCSSPRYWVTSQSHHIKRKPGFGGFSFTPAGEETRSWVVQALDKCT